MIVNIQFLRFVAAMLVVVYHASFHVRDAGAEFGWLFGAGQAVGFAGVDVFFVISGFIMVHTTRGDFGVAAAGDFLRRRVARIYSGYWPFFLLAIAVFGWAHPHLLERADFVGSAILWPARNLVLPVSWTLVFEMLFYLLFTGLVLLRTERRERWLLAGFVAVVAWSAFSHLWRRAYDPGQLEVMTLADYYLLGPYMAEFLAGGLVAAWLHRRPRGPAWSLLGTGVALFALAGWLNVTVYDNVIEQGYYVAPRVALYGGASVLIVAGMVRLEAAGMVAPQRFSILTGGASYATYLSHTLVLTMSQKLGFNTALRSAPELAVYTAFVALCVVILGLSVLYYRTLERWLHRGFRHTLGVGEARVTRTART